MTINFQKRHQAHGKYEKLVDLGKTAFALGHAPSVEAGIEAACHANPDLAALVLDPNAARDPSWHYLPVIKRCMGWTDPNAFQNACIDTASRLNPEFMKRVGRGEFLVPASSLVEKTAPDPLPHGKTATEALAHAAAQLVQKGMAPAEAQHQAQTEHPTWYPQYLRESRGR